ncbi:MAG: DNA repair protein RadC [Bacteroidales bacterium]|nr:DNA repair protein RadC [Bacteroidales bacterium]
MYDQPVTNNDNYRVCDLPDDDKPREKAMQHGIQSLTTAELIAIILGSGMAGKSVLSLARDILKDNNNNVYTISLMGIDEMCTRYKGVGPAKAISLKAAFELGTRAVDDAAKLPVRISASKDIHELMRQKLQLLDHEEFWILHLSRANRVIARECVSRGGTAATVVDNKIILKSALNKLSSGLILVHNHPSGNLQPSLQDDQITRRLKEGAALLDIRVLDHIIISPAGYYSYSDEGRL